MKKMRELGQRINIFFSNKKVLRNFLIVSSIILVIICVVIYISLKAKKEIEEFTVKNQDVYMYYTNQRFDYHTRLTLNRNNNITKILIDGEEEKELNSEPFYYKGEDKMMLPNNMIVVFPLENNIQKRVNYFSTVSMNGNKIDVNFNDINKDISDTFMFDGKNYYIFFDDVTIEFGKEKIKISPFSTVRCSYQGDLFIYNYKEDKMYTYEDVKDMVYAKNDYYTVNLSVDSIDYKGKEQLLLRNVDNLDLLK